MSRIIKEPFASRRHQFTLDQIAVRILSSFYQRFLRSALRADKLTEASLENFVWHSCYFLLLTTLLLPFVLL